MSSIFGLLIPLSFKPCLLSSAVSVRVRACKFSLYENFTTRQNQIPQSSFSSHAFAIISPLKGGKRRFGKDDKKFHNRSNLLQKLCPCLTLEQIIEEELGFET